MNEIHAQVARILSGSEIAINAGSNEGIESGDRVTIWRTVEIQDPATGESLGSVQRTRLRLEVTEVQEAFSVARVHIQVPNVAANIFGRQTAFITGAEVEDEKNVALKAGDDVTIYLSDDEVF